MLSMLMYFTKTIRLSLSLLKTLRVNLGPNTLIYNIIISKNWLLIANLLLNSFVVQICL